MYTYSYKNEVLIVNLNGNEILRAHITELDEVEDTILELQEKALI